MDRTWQSDFRTGLELPNNVNHKLIAQYIDSENNAGEQFYLYYFTKGPYSKKNNEPVKTILFCAGGPGQVFWPTGSDLFLSDLEKQYRVVYFHLRGAGLSQLPESNSYDKYLRTKYAVKDVDAIFEDIRKSDPSFKAWDAVVGLSYGTVLAQKYTAQNPKRVLRLVLASPLSRHVFKKPPADPERKDFLKTIASGYGLLLKQIYTSNTTRTFQDGKEIQTNLFKQEFPNFFDLVRVSRPDYNDAKIIDSVTEEITEILIAQDTALLTPIPLIDHYDELKREVTQATQSKGQEPAQLRQLLQYDRQFFIDLKDLREAGFAETLQDDKEIVVRALRIAAQVLLIKDNIDVRSTFKTRFHVETTDLCKSFAELKWRQDNKIIVDEAKKRGIWCPQAKCICSDSESNYMHLSGSSRRVFYNMSIYDGIDAGFLDKWGRQRGLEVMDLLDKKAQWWRLDPFIKLIGLGRDEPEIWDPSEHRHNVPTLILRGKADPVTAGKQANYVFEKALLGPRYMVEFDGVGHALQFGPIVMLQGSWPEAFQTRGCGFSGDIKPVNIRTRACILDTFINGKDKLLEDLLVLYHNKYAATMENATWVSTQPISCAVVRKPDSVIENNRSDVTGTVNSMQCSRSEPKLSWHSDGRIFVR